MANQYIRFPDVNTEASNVFVTNTSSSPVPVTIDGTITAATVKIEDSFGNPLASTSEALNTYLTNTTLAVTQSTTPWVISGTITANAGTGTFAVSAASLPLPTGAATSANQTNGTQVTQVSNFPATQPVSGTVTANAGTGTFAVSAASLPLPSGAATSANQTNGTQITQVSNFPATQPVSGTVTALQGTSPWVVSGTVTTSPNVNVHDGSGNSISSTTGALNVDVVNFPSLQNVNLTQVGGSSLALGQAAAASSLPVVTQSNSAPATQTITTQDLASTTTSQANGQNAITGTPTAGSAASFVLSSFESVEIQATGTWTGTVQTEVSMDGGTTWYTHGVKQIGSPYIGSSYTANFDGVANTAALSNIRVRAVAAMTGTLTIRIVASVQLASVVVSNPLTLRDATTQTISNTIKAASTASLATDTSLVVALSPNTQTPRMTDNSGSGTITAGGQTIVATTNGASTVLFSLTGTWSAILLAEIQAGDGNWVLANCYELPTSTPSSLLTTNGVYAVPCGGATQVRLAPFTFTSGTIAITYNVGAGTNLSYAYVSQGQAPWAVSGPNNYHNLTTAATTVLKSSTGRLYGVAVNTLVSGATLTLYDNTAGSGTIIATQTLVFTTSAATSYTWSPTLQNIGGVTFATGLTAVTTGTANWTIYYT